jgi:hypothetical protein
VTTVNVAQPQRLGLAGPVDGERVDPALGEIEAREDHAHFLGIVHAVEQHHGGAPAAARAAHEVGRQARPFVGHFDALDLGIEALHRRVIGAQRLAVHRHLLRAGRDEALGAVVVVARAHVVVTGGDVVSLRCGGVGNAGDTLGHRRPFLAPSPIEVGFRGARLEPPADALDLVHGNGRVGRHALDDLHGVRPAQIAGKMHGPSVCRRGRAIASSHRLVPPGKHMRQYKFGSGDGPVGLAGRLHTSLRNAWCLLFPAPHWRYPAASGLASERGRSSVVERQLPKLYVEGSIPFARSSFFK